MRSTSGGADGQELAKQRLEKLWRDHAVAVVRYARRRVPSPDVDEVVAETFLVAWRRLADVPEYALPWLLGVCRGVAANSVRTARRRRALTDRLFGAVRPETENAHAEHIDLPQDLRRAVAGLKPSDRELLALLAWDDLTREEAAEALGISRAALAVRLHRLRRRLSPEPDIAVDVSVPQSPVPPTRSDVADA